ncbi:MAG: hypothetical protein AB1595_00545 [bacterium]
MEVFGIAVAILTGILTYQTWKNGRWMKQAHEDTQALIREMHNDTRETLKESRKESQEAFSKMDETLKEIARLIKEGQETLGRLIVSEGNKTREAIKEAK